MKKLGTFALVGAAAAGILTAGAGIAAADDQTDAKPVVAVGEPSPAGTGSSAMLSALQKAVTGSDRSGPAQ